MKVVAWGLSLAVRLCPRLSYVPSDQGRRRPGRCAPDPRRRRGARRTYVVRLHRCRRPTSESHAAASGSRSRTAWRPVDPRGRRGLRAPGRPPQALRFLNSGGAGPVYLIRLARRAVRFTSHDAAAERGVNLRASRSTGISTGRAPVSDIRRSSAFEAPGSYIHIAVRASASDMSGWWYAPFFRLPFHPPISAAYYFPPARSPAVVAGVAPGPRVVGMRGSTQGRRRRGSRRRRAGGTWRGSPRRGSMAPPVLGARCAHPPRGRGGVGGAENGAAPSLRPPCEAAPVLRGRGGGEPRQPPPWWRAAHARRRGPAATAPRTGGRSSRRKCSGG